MVIVATPRVVEFAAKKGVPVRRKPKIRVDRFTWEPGDTVPGK